MIPRVYLPPVGGSDTRASLDPEQSLYLSQALRLRAGAQIQVFDGCGGRRSACLIKADRKACQIELGQSVAAIPPAPVSITLVQGIAQGDRMDWVVEKAVEMGVAQIMPVQSSRGQVRLSEQRAAKRVDHWRRIAIAACRQSGRDDLPTIYPVSTITSTLNRLADHDQPDGASTSFVLQPGSLNALSQEIAGHQELPATARLLVGPESGLSDAEVEKAIAQGWRAVGLGPRVLRTETAGIVAITILQTGWGDLAGCAKA